MPEEQTTPTTSSTAGVPPVPQAAVVVAGGRDEAPQGDLGPRQDIKRTRIPAIVAAFLPNRAISGTTFRVIVAIQLALFLLVWINSPFQVLPTPMEVLASLDRKSVV